MKLTFLGATHEVTGSCYYLQACGKNIIIDCGMEQGRDCFENMEIPVKASDIDMVLLTHAHIDHSGKLPLLGKQGFGGPIYCTEGTKLLCDIMLRDSAHIQEFEAEWKNRKAMRAGRDKVEPIYTVEDAQKLVRQFKGVAYRKDVELCEGITASFIDAGHLLGSASIILDITEGEVHKRLIFSGDIGNIDQPLINDPSYPDHADYVVMESTYGDRKHEKPADYAVALAEVLQRTFDRGGNVVIPSFAIGRTQEMLYFIREIKEQDMVCGHDDFEVWVDSPLAIEATGIFEKRMYDDFDMEASKIVKKGINPIGFRGLKTATTMEESKAINFDKSPKVIISASGMCDAGRIKHHLKHNLWRADSTIVFVGYQAEGTLGRRLVDGAEQVKLFGEDIDVEAEITVLPGISGHADNEGLIRWISSLDEKPTEVFVTHGDDRVTELFRDRLINELGLNAYAPYSGTVYDLAAGVFEYEAPPVPVVRESDELKKKKAEELEQKVARILGGTDHERKAPEGGSVSEAGVWSNREDGKEKAAEEKKAAGREERASRRAEEHRYSEAYGELVEAAMALMEVIRHNEGGANKDLRKFADQINKLCDHWDR